MEQEISVYEAAIANLEAERDEINRLIDGLRRRSARADGVPFVPSTRTAEEAEIQHDSFFGMTVADAAKKYLSMKKASQSTADIAAALERGGLKHSSKDFATSLRTTLNPKEEFLRVPNGDWGLTEWYPGLGRGKKTKAKLDKPAKRKTGKPKAGKEPKTAKGPKLEDRILDLMKTDPNKEWSSSEVTQTLEAPKQSVQSTMSRLAKEGKKITKVDKGYRLARLGIAA